MTKESKTAEQLSEMIASAMGHRGWTRRRGLGDTVALSSSQLSMLIEGIDWRAPERRWRPAVAG
jgi:hypothetical protein